MKYIEKYASLVGSAFESRDTYDHSVKSTIQKIPMLQLYQHLSNAIKQDQIVRIAQLKGVIKIRLEYELNKSTEEGNELHTMMIQEQIDAIFKDDHHFVITDRNEREYEKSTIERNKLYERMIQEQIDDMSNDCQVSNTTHDEDNTFEPYIIEEIQDNRL